MHSSRMRTTRLHVVLVGGENVLTWCQVGEGGGRFSYLVPVGWEGFDNSEKMNQDSVMSGLDVELGMLLMTMKFLK